MADNTIQTVSDMFRALEEEIKAVKDGSLPLDTARVVQRGRALQLKTAELNLQFIRVNRAQRTPKRELNLLTGREEAAPFTENVGSQDKPI